MTKTRKQTLESLLRLNEPLDSIESELGTLPWDSDAELLTVSRAHITAVLKRFVHGDLSKEQVERWANAVECRDDLGFEPGHEAVVKDAIWELANPELTRSVDRDVAQALIDRLSA